MAPLQFLSCVAAIKGFRERSSRIDRPLSRVEWLKTYPRGI
ncbi:hypothetical protein C4K34_1182 [Pseudomonas chlororaphis subsp. piscium]|nr:hypothetical protein C4K34_1182 [Pseudomonas chlororaphis subsp. piscium]